MKKLKYYFFITSMVIPFAFILLKKSAEVIFYCVHIPIEDFWLKHRQNFE